jgi:hypothetical protein
MLSFQVFRDLATTHQRENVCEEHSNDLATTHQRENVCEEHSKDEVV